MVVAAYLFFQCIEAWRSLPQAGVQGAKVSPSLVLHLYQVWLQGLSQVSYSQSSCCLRLCPSHHFGFLLFFYYYYCLEWVYIAAFTKVLTMY
jgi:hypothetical protein